MSTTTGDGPWDLRTTPAACAAWAAAAACTVSPFGVGVAVAATSAVAAVVLALSAPRRATRDDLSVWRSVATMACVGAAVVSLLALPATWPIHRDDLRHNPPLAGQPVELTLTTSVKRTASAGTVQRFWARADYRGHEVVVFADDAWEGLAAGTTVRTRARSKPTGRTDAAEVVVSPRPRTVEVIADPPWYQRVAAHARARFAEACDAHRGDGATLVPGLVIGDDGNQSTTLRTDLRTAGLTHLSAVSGSNMAIVTGLAFVLAAWCRLWLRGRLVVAGAALLGYATLVGPEPSVLRASVMGALALASVATSRQRGHLPALSVTVTGLLAVDPWLAWSPGFALSVVATASIVLLGPACTRALQRFAPKPVAAAVAVSVVATVGVAPILVALDGGVHPISVAANVLAAPLVPVVTVVGVLALLVSFASPAFAAPLLYPAVWASDAIATVARVAATVPPATAWALYVAVGGLCVWWWLRTTGRWGTSRAAFAGVAVGAVAVVAVAAPARTPLPELPGWVVAACDVGQGSATVVRDPGGAHMLVDVGPDPTAILACLRDTDVRSVDLLVLTHFHADHVAALADVLERVPVQRAWVSALPAPAYHAATARSALATHNVPVEVPAPDQRTAVGRMTVTALANHRTACSRSACSGAEINDASVVVLAETPNATVLLPGDAETTTQTAVARRLRREGRTVDILCTPHHGSATQVPALFRAARARIHVISAGVDNDYGHPSPKTLTLLEHVGGTIARTDTQGTVLISRDATAARADAGQR